MKITQLEQSGFILETENGYRLAFDIGKYTPEERLTSLHPIHTYLVSHIHGDHFSAEHIRGLAPQKVFLNAECMDALGEEKLSSDIVVVKDGETITENDITIKCFNVDHGPNVSSPLQENFGFLVTIEGQKVYFAGDMYYPSGLDVSKLEVDYALIPVGGFYTFGPEEAFAFSKQFKKIGTLIPMHYEKTPETKEQFLALAKNTFKAE